MYCSAQNNICNKENMISWTNLWWFLHHSLDEYSLPHIMFLQRTVHALISRNYTFPHVLTYWRARESLTLNVIGIVNVNKVIQKLLFNNANYLNYITKQDYLKAALFCAFSLLLSTRDHHQRCRNAVFLSSARLLSSLCFLRSSLNHPF